eukprot:2358970-Ditylum_brightwellii.AAC.1
MFTTDATAMFTNINLDHLLEAIGAWLKEHKDKLPKDFPTKLIMEALKLVTKSNVFSFGNTWWKQLIGTEMGMPCACIIAMLYFGLFERLHLLQNTSHGFSAIADSLIMSSLFGLQIATPENQNKLLPNSKKI